MYQLWSKSCKQRRILFTT